MQVSYVDLPERNHFKNTAFLRVRSSKAPNGHEKYALMMRETPSAKNYQVKTCVAKSDKHEHHQRAYQVILDTLDDMLAKWQRNYADSDLTLVVYAPKDYKTVLEGKGFMAKGIPAPIKNDNSVDRLTDYFGHKAKFKALIKKVARKQGEGDLGKGICYLKELSSEILEIADQLQEEFAEQIEEQNQKRAKAAEIAALMLEAGITLDDVASAPKPKKKKAPVDNPAQTLYQCIVEGQIIEYNGHGPLPTPMKNYITQNKTSLEALAV